MGSVNCKYELVATRDDRYRRRYCWKCGQCGRRVATHLSSPPPVQQCRRGLGDRIAAVAKKLGIKPCSGCERRRKLLNKIGRKLTGGK